VLRGHLWGDCSAIYAAATRAILLVQEHRDALTDENGEQITEAEIIEDLRENLEGRCAASDKSLFVGAVEDLVGFEFEHRQDDSFHTCQNAADWLLEQELQGHTVSLIQVILVQFPERKKSSANGLLEIFLKTASITSMQAGHAGSSKYSHGDCHGSMKTASNCSVG
jgi:hypothetical protein